VAAVAPEISPKSISEAGAAGLRKTFSGQELNLVLEAYMAGVKNVFAFAVAGSAASVLLALMIPPTRLPSHDEQDKNEDSYVASTSTDK
jgi:uncharacterized membrane protein YraQ (UPF0718 family)